MTYYADLTLYSYLQDSIDQSSRILNVGWLEREYDYPSGATSGEFREKLLEIICDHSTARTRGWHACSLPHPGGDLHYPFTVEVNDRTIRLGSAEVRVTTEGGSTLAAPDLIYHYVTDHNYLPPDPFIEAVLEMRVA